MTVTERFLNYVKIHTASAEDTENTPTTQCQFDLSKLLAREMREMGMEDVRVDEHAYTYGFISAAPGYETRPAIGLIAHLDTVPDFPGENVKPQVIENYDGGDVKLGDSGRVLETAMFPHLKELKGQTLITTDGTTVLGSDDKAGIAEIMAACERIIKENIPHGPIAVCFTPDEEVGHGAELLDLELLNVDFAYTVDGEEMEELNYETFNAAAARFEITGFNIHPGGAKDRMINASLVAMEANSMLPAGDVPSHTTGYEGFFHLTDMEGTVEKATLNYIVRDHSASAFEVRKEMLRHVEKVLNEKYGSGTVKLTLREQYRNMAQVLESRMGIIELAKKALVKAGIEPVCRPVRGGTDGAQLSFRGLPCPNVGTGGYCCHGPCEHITAERLEKMTEVVVNIIAINAE